MCRLNTSYGRLSLYLRLVVLGSLALISVDPVCGQVTSSQYSGAGNFVYTVQNMPDLDQNRNGLPGDGEMYCLPTAGMNLVAYAANFGFPELPPYPSDWEGATSHDEMTDWLNVMGQFMNTDPDAGTSYLENYDGLNFWVGGWSFSINHTFRADGYWPNIDGAAFHAANGAIINFRYGRYIWTPNNSGTPVIVAREGGHSVTLQSLSANTGNNLGPRLLYYRNPGSDEAEIDLNSNSNYSSTVAPEAENIQVLFDADNDGTPDPFIVTALKNPPVYTNDERYRFVDEVLSLYPPAGFSYSVYTLNPNFVNGGLGFVQDQQPVPFDAPHGEEIISVIPHPESHSGLALVTQDHGPCTLYQTPHGYRGIELLNLPEDTRCLALGFGHTVYAATDREIIELRVLNGVAERVKQHQLPVGKSPKSITALTYHDRSRKVIAVAGKRAYVLNSRNDKVRRLRIQGLARGSEIGSLVVWRNKLYGTTENAVVQATISAEGRTVAFKELSLSRIRKPVSIDIDSSDRMYVCDESRGLLEYTFRKSGRWVNARKPLFPNVDCVGKRFVALKSHTNVRRGEHSVLEWFNIKPDELEENGPDVPD